MQTYTSRGGIELEAHVVEEKSLQVTLATGIDHLGIGDALVTLDGAQFVVRAALFQALFGDEDDDESESDPDGGQHGSAPPPADG